MNKDLFLYNQQKQRELFEKVKTKSFSEIVEESKSIAFEIKNPYFNRVDDTAFFNMRKETNKKKQFKRKKKWKH